VSDERPPFTYEGLDPAPEPKSTITEIVEAKGYGGQDQ
jgi:hypothetical protein